jgi:hypothetical protein
MSKQARIFERNPDTGVIRSRKARFGTTSPKQRVKPHADIDALMQAEQVIHGNQKLTANEKLNGHMVRKMHIANTNLRTDVLNDIWAANKKVIDGKWYVELAQVCAIVGGRI